MMKLYHPKIQATADGSSTLVHPVMDELYHSRHGAWTESQHIFIKYGLMPIVEKGNTVTAFEMGFGSGLNAAMAREVAQFSGVSIKYTAIELYPVDQAIVTDMRMPDQSVNERNRWMEIHLSPWDEPVVIDSYFTLHKIQGSFPEAPLGSQGYFDLIFYDAFAPGAQPELWGIEALGRCYDLLKPGGVWISYCSKGSVKRNLQEVGFQVEALPGPPGKREITRAYMVKGGSKTVRRKLVIS